MQSSSGPGINPVLAIVSQADSLANAFTQTHSHSLPLLAPLQQSAPDSTEQEHLLSLLRTTLSQLEHVVSEMMTLLLTRVDLFLSDPDRCGVSSFDPKEACRHVSELFHMYQSELLAKREGLADFTCEEIGVDEFVRRWATLDEVQQGKKQEVDDLADLLAKFG